MPLSEKQLQTIVSKYGSYEAYLELRYRNPENAEKRREAARKAGKASQASPNAKRPFTDPEKAREAQKRGVEARRRG